MVFHVPPLPQRLSRGAKVSSKSEAGGISRNPYQEILMTKLPDICLASLAQNFERCVWSSKSPPNQGVYSGEKSAANKEKVNFGIYQCRISC